MRCYVQDNLTNHQKPMNKDKMKKVIHLNRGQAEALASDLMEYVKLKDSSVRDVFSGFWLSIDSNNFLCLEPIPNHTLIEADKD